jgi:hypothetical protein
MSDEETKKRMIIWYWNVIEQYKTKDGADQVPAELKELFVSLSIQFPKENMTTRAADEAARASSFGEPPLVNMDLDEPAAVEDSEPKTSPTTADTPSSSELSVDMDLDQHAVLTIAISQDTPCQSSEAAASTKPVLPKMVSQTKITPDTARANTRVNPGEDEIVPARRPQILRKPGNPILRALVNQHDSDLVPTTPKITTSTAMGIHARPAIELAPVNAKAVTDNALLVLGLADNRGYFARPSADTKKNTNNAAATAAPLVDKTAPSGESSSLSLTIDTEMSDPRPAVSPIRFDLDLHADRPVQALGEKSPQCGTPRPVKDTVSRLRGRVFPWRIPPRIAGRAQGAVEGPPSLGVPQPVGGQEKDDEETDDEEDVEEKDSTEKDDDNPPDKAIGLNTRITKTQDLEPLRCQAWFDLKGFEVEFIKKKAKKTAKLTGTDASSITDAFFGPKWMGGCAERIIAIAQGNEDLDISIRAAQQAANPDNNMPDEFRLVLRCLQTVKHNDFKDSTFALSRYLGLISFANAWGEVHNKLDANTSTADASKKRHDLLSFSFGKASYLGKSRSQCVREAKNKLCSLCKIRPGQFDRTKELSLLPLAIIEHFGTGGLLFLPSSRDPARQIWSKRSGLSSIFNSIKRSSSGQDGGVCLGVVAQRIKVEIIDRIDNGSLGWNPDTVATLSPDMPILTILDKLRDSRNPETGDTDRHEMES